jgi:flagellar biosynthesis/type III secretory pathway chaperone
MADATETLARILNEQLKTYTDLADVIRTQQQIVSEGRLDELSTNLEKEVALIARGKYLEQARREFMWELADLGEIPRDNLTLPELIDHMGNGASATLVDIRCRLRSAVAHLREVNARNAELLLVSLRAIDNVTSTVFGPNGKSYSPKGLKTDDKRFTLLDHTG